MIGGIRTDSVLARDKKQKMMSTTSSSQSSHSNTVNGILGIDCGNIFQLKSIFIDKPFQSVPLSEENVFTNIASFIKNIKKRMQMTTTTLPLNPT